MTVFQPVNKLLVHRTLSSGQKVLVGTLAQNITGVYFQYDADYQRDYHSLSPFHLAFNQELQLAQPSPHYGLHGVFADSLPDGWGTLLMDRVMRQHGVLPNQLTAMDRLAYIGERAMGALGYSPESEYVSQENAFMDLATLGRQALAIYDGQSEQVLAQLANAGSSGGARPKAQIYRYKTHTQKVSTVFQQDLEPWLIKFTSGSLALGHEESLCEAAYLTLAKKAGIDVPEWQLITAPKDSPAQAWLALKRFDCTKDGGRYHMHSACGLLDADYRSPSLDYLDLIKASQILCNSPAVAQTMFRRAVFNLFTANQDDHSKNWAFLMDDEGQWRPSPFYDVTFSPSPYGEHHTAFSGHGKAPPLKVMQQLAAQANFASWKKALQVIEEVLDAIQGFSDTAKELGVTAKTIKLIDGYLQDVRLAQSFKI